MFFQTDRRLLLGCSWLWRHRSKGPIIRSPGHTAWRVPWLSFSVLVRCLWEEPVNNRKNWTSPCSPSRSASSQSLTVSTHLPCHRKTERFEIQDYVLMHINWLYIYVQKTYSQVDPSLHMLEDIWMNLLIMCISANLITKKNVHDLLKVYYPCF